MGLKLICNATNKSIEPNIYNAYKTTTPINKLFLPPFDSLLTPCPTRRVNQSRIFCRRHPAMSHIPEGFAQFEYQRMQIIGSLGTVADAMRACANMADQFSQVLGNLPYPSAFQGQANGQFVIAGLPQATPAGRKRKSRAEDDADGKKRRVKKPRDPDAPKRPASSYLLFQNEIRKELKAKYPDLRNNELLSEIAKLWAEMPQEQKEVYEARNRAEKDVWLSKKSLYETRTHPGNDAVASPVVKVTPELVKPVAAAPVVSTSDDESSDGEENSSTGSSSEEEEPQPPPKKSKKDAPVIAKVEGASVVKEKKQKKAKA
ncbi:High mobility group protein 1.2 [Grifola frondosa]|uniref:High mobility group protein 1.2 n=1 Tax=Grifola frondosa TaxID=5627 RepID=A0A1C7M4D9_GRIFR|nr:High mobility group protein 1.2 [Grifola frondosa]